MISFLKKTKNLPTGILQTDMHSHLLASLDDGVKTHEEAIELILKFRDLGYRKLITTPHIMSDYYPNEPTVILNKLQELKEILAKRKIDFEIEASAEYYLDETLIKKITARESLLTFGNRYLLFETNFFTEPYQLNEFIFAAHTNGYKPILAHPERYQYMSISKAEDIKGRDVLLQLNITSLIGAYGKPVMKMAEKLIENKLIDFLGSDCHSMNHLKALKTAFQNKYFIKALDLPLLNNSL